MWTKTEKQSAQPSAGSGMDQKIEGRGSPWKKAALIALLGLGLGTAWNLAALALGTERSYSIDADALQIGKVLPGTFEDYIPLRATVAPRATHFLDATEGGRVEAVHAEDGQMLEQGDLIVSLGNSALQLSVTNAEAQVAEQLNNMRALELSLEQNRLANAREVADLEYRIAVLSRELEGDRRLAGSGALREREVRDKEDELAYRRKLLTLARESQVTDKRLQEQQLAAQRLAAERLERNLEVARRNLDDLHIRAPIPGKLSGFDIREGQTVPAGGRIGQVDLPDRFKLQAHIDEFYINRVDPGQQVSYRHDGREYAAEIVKIYPQVKNAQFEVDIRFAGDEPPGLRRGQTLQARLTLGEPAEALLIPNGAFFQDTGGHWVFVLDSEGDAAVKREVVLGRRNGSQVEVLEGLSRGERVITSAYAGFLEMDRLEIGN